MDIAFMTKYLPMYERAAVLTVKIGLIGIAFAILLGLICAMIQYHKVPVARQIVAVYIEISQIHRFWCSYSLFIMAFQRSAS